MRRRRQLAVAALGALAVALLPGRASSAHTFPKTYKLPGATTFPEGVAAHSPKFWVSSFDHGTIYVGDIHNAQTHVWLAGETSTHPADGRRQAAGMKASTDGTKLFVAGGQTGFIWVYDVATKHLIRRFDTGSGGILNEIALAPNGTAYVTDSKRPLLFRINAADLPGSGTPGDTVAMAPWVANLPAYTTVPGIPANANGVVANAVNVIYVQSNTGRLWKVHRNTKAVTEIPIDTGVIQHSDGMLLDHGELLVVRNSLNAIDKLTIDPATGHAAVTGSFTSGSLKFPTGIAALPMRLLVVNSQMDKKGPPPTPTLPFTVRAIPRPLP